MSFETFAPPPAPREGSGCVAYGLFVVTILWIVFVLAISAPIEWAIRDVMMIGGLPWPWWASPATALVQAVLIAAPAGLLAALTRAPLLRATYLTWAAAS